MCVFVGICTSVHMHFSYIPKDVFMKKLVIRMVQTMNYRFHSMWEHEENATFQIIKAATSFAKLPVVKIGPGCPTNSNGLHSHTP